MATRLTKQVKPRIFQDTNAALEKLARAHGLPKTTIARMCIEHGIEAVRGKLSGEKQAA